MKPNKFFLNAAALIICTESLTGCSNNPGEDVQLNSSLSALSNSSGKSVQLDTSEPECKARAANVKSTVGNAQYGEFTVCTDPADFFRVDVFGNIEVNQADLYSGEQGSKGICFFPAKDYGIQPMTDPTGTPVDASKPQENSAGLPSQIAFKPDSKGHLMFQCFSFEEGTDAIEGVSVRFDQTYYDVLFVTSLENRMKMQNCLMSKQLGLCPAYAKGKFR